LSEMLAIPLHRTPIYYGRSLDMNFKINCWVFY
jgi:hypothetical protein